jgi:hypothetical protein
VLDIVGHIVGDMTSKANHRLIVAAAGLVVLTGPAAGAQNGSSFLDASRSAIDYTVATTRPAVACESLVSLTDHDYTVVSVTRVDATPDVAEHCRVFGVIPPEIRFNVNLPTGWNGRFYMHGNGAMRETRPIARARCARPGRPWHADSPPPTPIPVTTAGSSRLARSPTTTSARRSTTRSVPST